MCCDSNTASHLVRKRGVVLLQHARHVRVGGGHRDRGVGVAGEGVGAVVHAGDAQAEGGGEARLLRRELELVEHNALEVAL